MKHLLDTSAIAALLARYKDGALDILKKCATIDLAFYELGNVIWKEYALFRRITIEEALKRASDAYNVLKSMKMFSIIKPEEYMEIMSTATRLNLTFYDSAFLTLSKLNRFKLVTQDKELIEKASNMNAQAITIEELLRDIEASP